MAAAVLASLVGAPALRAENPFIILQSTTSTENSGLFGYLLPIFTAKTGIDVRVVAVGGIRDTQCGFKLLRGDLARGLFADLRIDRFAYDVELVWLARRRGAVVREVGVVWHDSPASSVHALRDSARMLLDVLKIRWRHRGEPVVIGRVR